MLSKYAIFCNVIETGNFTRTAEHLGYSQSAISQTVKSLEKEFGLTLIERKKDGIELTADGAQLFPFIRSIHNAEQSLERKHSEMMNLETGLVRIGTFTSVSRIYLPRLIKEFKTQYPNVEFVLQQGDYVSVDRWLKEGVIDLGFVNADMATTLNPNLHMKHLYVDEMKAILPKNHPLTTQTQVTMKQLQKEPFILIDEGEYSLTLETFRKAGLTPQIEYQVFDDYSILAMVREGLGISMMYETVLTDVDQEIRAMDIKEDPKRHVAIGWMHFDTIPIAAQRFAKHVAQHFEPLK